MRTSAGFRGQGFEPCGPFGSDALEPNSRYQST